MLLQISHYIAKQGVVSTQQLTREFHLDSAALQPMLDIWVRKGKIKKCEEKTGCASACFKCRTPPEYYEFIF